MDVLIYAHDPQETKTDEELKSLLAAAGFNYRSDTDEKYVNRKVWIYGKDGIRIDFFIL